MEADCLNQVHGILATEIDNKLFSGCSTIEVAASRKVGEAVAAAATTAASCDAPVSGGVGGAAADTLMFLIGIAKRDLLIPC